MIQSWVFSRRILSIQGLIERRNTGQRASISLVSLLVVKPLALSDIDNRRIWAFTNLLGQIQVNTRVDHWSWGHAEVVAHFILVFTTHGKALLPPVGLTSLVLYLKLLELLLNLPLGLVCTRKVKVFLLKDRLYHL